LGHTPFGHAGQDALNDCMREFGGFEHNLQSLRVVDELEARYPDFDGLNLTFEAREGILKHCSRRHAEALEKLEPMGVGHRFLARTQPSLEAQLCNLADEIAYNAHDIDDGVRSGLITLEQLQDVPLFDAFRRETLDEYPALNELPQGRRLLYESIRRMLSAQVYDVIAATSEALEQVNPMDVSAVRLATPLVKFNESMQQQSQVLKSFLLSQLYRHPQVMDMTGQAQQVVRDLFAQYMESPQEMGAGYLARCPAEANDSDDFRARRVADYIAGMTDRFAGREHERLTGLRWLT
jgi:dGTPase